MEKRIIFLKLVRGGLIGAAISTGLNGVDDTSMNFHNDPSAKCLADNIVPDQDIESTSRLKSKGIIKEGIVVTIRSNGQITKGIC